MNRRAAPLVLLMTAALIAAQAQAGNDDSCDIGVTPAATLLLPYFEVDFQSRASCAHHDLHGHERQRPAADRDRLGVCSAHVQRLPDTVRHAVHRPERAAVKRLTRFAARPRQRTEQPAGSRRTVRR